ncbi:hercynine metabolism protein [Synechococcus sp. 8F6]|uniref:hercynine metabolism protein n=1 Tax=Synechococcus sp. 8F6 TaxID=2025606 RepID=UPI000B994530|nr:hercynine metabolism protein [Synechococcus sp. 8F6]
MSWLDELEARLDQQLESFLRANPAQEALLEEQEARDRQAKLVGQRRQLQRQAEQERQALLQLANEIRRWQERVIKARAAGATALAERAEAHQQGLMEQGRQRWQHLSELGVSFAAVERDLGELESRPRPPRASSLEQDWAAFEAEQALEQLRRRQA